MSSDKEEKEDSNHMPLFATDRMIMTVDEGPLAQDLPITMNGTGYQRRNDDSNIGISLHRERIRLETDSNDEVDIVGAFVTTVDANIYDDNVQNDDEDDYCWEDISFHSEERDKHGKQGNEQKEFLEDEKQENIFSRTIACWLKLGSPKSDNGSHHEDHEGIRQFARDAVIKSAALPLEHTSDYELNQPGDPYERETQRSRFSAVLRLWTAADKNNESESPLCNVEGHTLGDPVSDVYAESTSHSSDAGSIDQDYEDSNVDLTISALDWLQSNNDVLAEDETSVSSDIIGSLGSGYGSFGNFLEGRRTPKQRSLDRERVVQWMRKGKGKGRRREDKYDPTTEYRKLDGMLPKKKNGATPEDRAHEIESALDWLRSEGDSISIEEYAMDEPAIDFSTNNFGPAPVCVTSPEDRREELRSIMTWIRNKGKGMKSKFDPNGNFRKLDKILPKRRGQTLEHRAIEMEGVMDWMRNSDLIPKGATSLPERLMFEKLESFHVSRRTPEERVKDLDHVMLWMRQERGSDDEITDPTGDFSKLNLILEVKEGQSSEDRAKEIERNLDWLRNTYWENDNDSLPLESSSTPQRSPRSSSSRESRPQRRRRTPSPKRKRNPDAKIPMIIGVSLDEEPNLFASIGHVVNVVATPSDASTMIDDASSLILNNGTR